jgi:Mrp family chromosome partitioning ATPase/uncharacterized protein involved in exopolysaccharide biosynthesis
MILILALLAVGASLAVRYAWPVPYQSEAELLIKWVATSHPVGQGQGSTEARYVTPDQTESIINSELRILTSQDVITQVVDVVGAAKVLGRPKGETNLQSLAADRLEAAQYIKQHLTTAVIRDSDIISLSFSHSSPDVPQQLLSQLISIYQTRHRRIHQPDEEAYLDGNIGQISDKLHETEINLRKAKSDVNITSLDASIRETGTATAALSAAVRETETELAVAQSAIRDRQALLAAAGTAQTTNGAATTTNQAQAIPATVLIEYQRNNALLTAERAKEVELLEGGLTTKAARVQWVENQIAEKEAKSKQMEQDYPGLLAAKAASAAASMPGGTLVMDPRTALTEAIVKEHALEVKYQVLTNQLARLQARSDSINGAEGKISELQRQEELYQKELAFYQQRLEEARADQFAAPGNSSIEPTEYPTMALRDMKKLIKAANIALFGGLALALSLPFLMELYLDQSLKRASDIDGKLGVPFFISLPKVKINGKRRALKDGRKVPLLPNGKTITAADEPALEPIATGPLVKSRANGEISPWDQEHALRPFFETLRDRLMTYFEVINLTHKPKLVAITSCSAQAGVTTTAAGLASSLSETGEGNVLLVDMNVRDGQAHHFYKGKLTCPLEDVFEKGRRGDALGQGNLYIAQDADASDSLPRVLPKRFSHLVPKMRASDYDYIIFDMPPISQISITPRLARFMDMVLLVVESEKTDREAAKHATKLLTEAKTNVGIVLNKSREYLPRRLQQNL